MRYLGLQHVVIDYQTQAKLKCVCRQAAKKEKSILTGCHIRDVLLWKSYFQGTKCAGKGSPAKTCHAGLVESVVTSALQM